MEINKNTANAYTYYEKCSKQCYACDARTTYFFHNRFDLNHKLF